MDQESHALPPFSHSLDKIIGNIEVPSPEDTAFYRYNVLPIVNAYTRLHAQATRPNAAEIALQLTTESHGSPVHTKDIAAFMQIHPELLCDLSDEEKRFLLEVGITNELHSVRQRMIALTQGLLPSVPDEELFTLVEQQTNLEHLQSQLCERLQVSTVPASYLK